jgi:hypothetical protein
MFHHDYRNPVQVFFPFSLLFLRPCAGNAFRLFQCVFLCSDSLGFVKEVSAKYSCGFSNLMNSSMIVNGR